MKIHKIQEWMRIGDFNAIKNLSEKWGGRPLINKSTKDFQNVISQGGLLDLKHQGPAYTWTNRRRNLIELIKERLDRVLATLDWCLRFPRTKVNHLPMVHSDHAPILLNLQGQKVDKTHSFKYEERWHLEDGYEDLVKTEWNSISGNIIEKSKHLSLKLFKWQRKHYIIGNID